MLTNKKTGEITGPHQVAIAIKYVLKHINHPPNPTSPCSKAVLDDSLVYLEYRTANLNLDQFRHLLKKISVKGYCPATKFKCRMLLAHHVQFQKFFNHETNLNSSANLAKKLNLEVRRIQAFFHPNIFEQMMQVNNLKGRCDHENGMSEKQTWSSLADLYNSMDQMMVLISLIGCFQRMRKIIQSIAVTLATKEVREAKEDLKRGRLELLRMAEILPSAKKRIKSKLLADYGIESPLKVVVPKATRVRNPKVTRKSLSSMQEADISSTLTMHSSDDDDEDIYS
jgi:hypothetical protein